MYNIIFKQRFVLEVISERRALHFISVTLSPCAVSSYSTHCLLMVCVPEREKSCVVRHHVVSSLVNMPEILYHPEECRSTHTVMQIDSWRTKFGSVELLQLLYISVHHLIVCLDMLLIICELQSTLPKIHKMLLKRPQPHKIRKVALLQNNGAKQRRMC